jgi:hypothetical protein
VPSSGVVSAKTGLALEINSARKAAILPLFMQSSEEAVVLACAPLLSVEMASKPIAGIVKIEFFLVNTWCSLMVLGHVIHCPAS